MQLLTTIENENASAKRVNHFDVGDMVDVHVWITEGDKRRVQIFSGLVTSMNNGRGVRGTFTVRRIVASQGVERIFPFHSPNLEKVTVTRYGQARRSKLYYLRNRIGKEALKVPELIGRTRQRMLIEADEAEQTKKKGRKRGKKAKAERRARQEAEGKKPAKKKKKKKPAKKKPEA